ncbi:MAG: GNAT family N-acetyltransferase [Kurthia sp.]|nr:GNAT family N-acetyltransferase [Candidatus Kurthia equi]
MEEIDLQNEIVYLRRMTVEDLQAISDIALDTRIWTYTAFHLQSLSDIKEYIKKALEQFKKGSEYPFVIIERQTGKIVGCTRFYNIDFTHKRLAIGYTWINPCILADSNEYKL